MDYRKITLAFLLCSLFFFAEAQAQEIPDRERFVKLDGSGQELPADAEQWSMVMDRSTGLIWEVKTTDGSIHDKDKVYDWRGAREDFIAELNAMRFGGFGD
ncbi:MAG TPA: hypothetical protein ENN06_08025 [Desulfobacteraceae bacterium]|nr:hypothetical protein [Desulfobacteraceae bacterium]